MRRFSVALFLLCAAGAISPLATRLAAQEQRAAISADLVLGLQSRYYSDARSTPRLLVAAMPDSFPREILPPQSTVLGSLVDPFGESTVVAALPEPAAEAERLLEQRLRAAGWERVDRDHFGDRSGFAAAVPVLSQRMADSLGLVPGRQSTLSSAEFCRGNAIVRARSMPSGTGAGTTLLRLEFTGSRSAFACGGTPADAIELPLLQAPAGVRVTSSGRSRGGSTSAAHASMTTPLMPAQLLAHYAAELQRAGWSTGEPQVVGDVATQQVSVQGAAGRLWKGVLSVTALPWPDERVATLYIMRPADRRGEWMP